jgi:hypothetical protein
MGYSLIKQEVVIMQNLNRLTNEQLAKKARVTYNAHGHDYLSYKESNYIDRAIARHNTNGMGYFSMKLRFC